MSEGLGYELSSYGVDVCCWRPAAVSTKLMNYVKPDAITATPDQFVEACFNKCNAESIHGILSHELIGLVQDQVNDIFPWFSSFLMSKVCDDLKKKDGKKSE